MDRAAAEALAQEALIWILRHEELLPVFLNATGSDVQSVRDGARDADFLASVLDFMMLDDAWIVGFCDAEGHAYGVVGRARAALPGGGAVHWT